MSSTIAAFSVNPFTNLQNEINSLQTQITGLTVGTGSFATLNFTNGSGANMNLQNLAVNGGTSIGGQLNVGYNGQRIFGLNGTTSLEILSGNVAIGTSVASAVGVTGTLNVSSGITTASTLNVSGASTLAAVSATSITDSGALNVTGLSTLGAVNATNVNASGVMTGATINAGTLNVSGASTLAAVSATSITDSGALNVSGNITCSGALNQFFGPTILAGTQASSLQITGLTTFNTISSTQSSLAATDTTIAYKLPITIGGTGYYIALTLAQ